MAAKHEEQVGIAFEGVVDRQRVAWERRVGLQVLRKLLLDKREQEHTG
jgi:hypothetical protein